MSDEPVNKTYPGLPIQMSLPSNHVLKSQVSECPSAPGPEPPWPCMPCPACEAWVTTADQTP
jgi:hypothetical protein